MHSLIGLPCVCRFAKYHERDGLDSRDLVKAYGILFKVEVIGTVSYI